MTGPLLLPSAKEVCEGYVSTHVCLSTRGEEYLGRYPPARYTLRQVHPLRQVPSGQVHPRAGTPQPGTPPWAGTPPWQVHPPRQVRPQAGTPWAGTPSLGGYPPDRYPPGQVQPGRYTPHLERHTPQSSACWEIRATSGWYASYWNAFLFSITSVVTGRMRENWFFGKWVEFHSQYLCSGGSGISQARGANPRGDINFDKKLHENERNWTEGPWMTLALDL